MHALPPMKTTFFFLGEEERERKQHIYVVGFDGTVRTTIDCGT
jgi:hypothetical protein